MAATRYTTRFPTTKLPDCTPRTPCEPAPVCPACGGLECLCRPRFFAGQLLTEDDLNRLDDYIVAKNRLHNRYLIGWGVACGLEVVCDACDPAKSKGDVVVKAGYALSPCGNDIIVCGDTVVDICDLIARCRPADDMCVPSATGAAPSRDCGEGTEEWILGICYAERPSRGVTALLNQSTPSPCSCGGRSGCGCGGRSGCGCGASSKKGAAPCRCKGTTKPAPKSPPQPECEPTLTCESYSFAVWKAPKPAKNARTWGAAATRFICCVEPFLTALGQYPTGAAADDLTSWYFDLREAVREFLIGEGLYDCMVAARLAAATTPDVTEANETKLQNSVLRATYSVLAIAALVIQKCLCAALLPRCPDMAETDCVPIATVTVKRRPCEVVSICNIAARKFLVTIPNIEYWLSFFTMFQSSGGGGFDSLRTLLERICCTDIERWFLQYTRTAGNVFAPREAAPGAAPEAVEMASHVDATTSPIAAILADALAHPGREINPATLMLAAMGARDRTGQPLASELELEHPTDFLLAHQVLAPALRALVPALTPERAGARAVGGAPDLAHEVADLKKTVAKQQREIDQLRKSRRR